MQIVSKYIVKTNISKPFQLIISKGSIIEFKHDHGAIVNAANEACLGGGGVDGAISNAGGESLFLHRLALPIISSNAPYYYEKRCEVGDAKITGPGKYGSLGTPYVIHAVGPDYRNYMDDSFDIADALLKSAYEQSLERGKENQLHAIAFSLISAGIYRGEVRLLEDVLMIGINSIVQSEGYEQLEEIHLFGYSDEEVETLINITKKCNDLKKIDDD